MLTIIILYNNMENKFNYYYSGLIFSISLGLLCEIIRNDIIPITDYKEGFELFSRVLSAFSYRLSPYFAILAGSEMYYKGKNKKMINIVLFLPIILGFIVDFIYPETSFITLFPDNSPLFWTIVIWAVPYGLITYILLVLSYYKEKSQWLKQQKLLACILMLPTIIFMVSAYFLPLFFHFHPFKYNLLGDIIFFLLFLIFALKYGTMGVKISLEKMKNDATIKVISTGTMILLHALKNELNNISINSECLNSNDPSVISIQRSSKRMLTMIQRVHTELEHIEIRKKPDNFNELIEELLDSLSIYLKNNNIKVVKKIRSDLTVNYDPLYFKEAIVNILKNAIEAMNNGGTLEIFAEITGKNVLIKIKDTGNGISKENLPHVIEPFFSTKQNIEKNFGLGLSSSYRIIRQHKGIVEISSRTNEGTTVLIRIPQ